MDDPRFTNARSSLEITRNADCVEIRGWALPTQSQPGLLKSTVLVWWL